MPDVSIRAARQHAIENQIKRLDRWLASHRVVSNRVSWLRVIVFGAGIAATVFAANQNLFAGIGVFSAAMLLFAAVVVYHRNIERWIDTFAIWRDFRRDQLARMNRTWEQLTNFAVAERRHSLALDLDITGEHSLHQLIDTTLSREASRRLADWLTQAHPKLDEVHARQNIVQELVAFARFRERFALTFRLVLRERLEGEPLMKWLSIALPSSRLLATLLIATALIALNLILFAAHILLALPAIWLITLLVYFVFWFANQSWLAELFDALNRLDAELARFHAILDFIEHADYRTHPHLANLCASFRNPHHSPSMHTRKIQLVTFGVGLRSNPVLGLALNLILPWDFLLAWLINRVRAQVVDWFPKWVQVCYDLDAYVALANFAYIHPDYVFPTLASNPCPVLSAKNLGHPLIPHAQNVRNDFAFDSLGELAILTGSNMAGKSTFLKSIGINLCLAYAGAPVMATQFVSALFRLHTCIRITDSVTDGFSYFYAEVQCLKRLLDELQAPNALPLLYLIDEIFRGTNNRERLLGSRTYIQALIGANGVGLIATHDLELASLADQQRQIHNYHFRDDVSNGKLVFDYKLRRGPSPTTNALKIMMLAGLPTPEKF